MAETCPYCDRIVDEDEIITCPDCGRDGCCTATGGCMPAGEDCICPECEELLNDE